MGHPTSGPTEDEPLLIRPVSDGLNQEHEDMKKHCWSGIPHSTRIEVLVVMAILAGLTCLLYPSVRSQWITSHTPKHFIRDVHWQQLCNDKPCFEKKSFCVPEGKAGFPSFWNYAPHGPISVSYDERAILLNGTRSLFLGGSMHPARATPETWESALDQAVKNGLNLITIYVFWALHQPFPGSSYDWSLPGNHVMCKRNNDDQAKPCTSSWDLASAIREAANRGLFVHARLGPYACGEYNYGGIPEFVALHKPNMSMRRPNQAWMDAMEGFLNETIHYLTQEQLWAHQGGPIILAQVENELGDELDVANENIITVLDKDGKPSKATMQDYADWSGQVAAKYAPKVVWTMCNGLTARNAINTCNGYGGVSCSKDWLESYGQSGRIQVDQPALWTENEQGFQVWGETPERSSYLWGSTARDVALDALKWFARGGSHLNYYMWWGGYNRGRAAAGGITNMYASDAILCSNGQRRQPKYDHLQSLHSTMIEIAPYLLESPSGLFRDKSVYVMGANNNWEPGDEQRMFIYETETATGTHSAIVFVENDSDEGILALLDLSNFGNQTITMQAKSGVVIINGRVAFDSASIDPRAKAVRRAMTDAPVALLDWQSFLEPIGANPAAGATQTHLAPIEQTQLMVSSHKSSDYAWYTTFFTLPQSMGDLRNATISIEAQKASAMSVYLNDKYIGTEADPHHDEGNITFDFNVGTFRSPPYKLSILSENLGYGNLIGRFGANTKEKVKGITGSVSISGKCNSVPCSFSLVDRNSKWYSFAGLNGEYGVVLASFESAEVNAPQAIWSRAFFDTPNYDPNSQSLFVDITAGRGHLWLNGYDLGRYWNITRGDTSTYTQRYYYLPNDYLYTSGELNELLLFNSLGGDHSDTQLILSELVSDEHANMDDEVAFPTACI